jgi:hypothetical protein
VSKQIAIVALVVLIILLAIPLGIGIAMSGCPGCPAVGTSHALGLCLTLAAMVILFVAMSFIWASAPLTRGYALLLTRSLERPPRIV